MRRCAPKTPRVLRPMLIPMILAGEVLVYSILLNYYNLSLLWPCFPDRNEDTMRLIHLPRDEMRGGFAFRWERLWEPEPRGLH